MSITPNTTHLSAAATISGVTSTSMSLVTATVRWRWFEPPAGSFSPNTKPPVGPSWSVGVVLSIAVWPKARLNARRVSVPRSSSSLPDVAPRKRATAEPEWWGGEGRRLVPGVRLALRISTGVRCIGNVLAFSARSSLTPSRAEWPVSWAAVRVGGEVWMSRTSRYCTVLAAAMFPNRVGFLMAARASSLATADTNDSSEVEEKWTESFELRSFRRPSVLPDTSLEWCLTWVERLDTRWRNSRELLHSFGRCIRTILTHEHTSRARQAG